MVDAYDSLGVVVSVCPLFHVPCSLCVRAGWWGGGAVSDGEANHGYAGPLHDAAPHRQQDVQGEGLVCLSCPSSLIAALAPRVPLAGAGGRDELLRPTSGRNGVSLAVPGGPSIGHVCSPRDRLVRRRELPRTRTRRKVGRYRAPGPRRSLSRAAAVLGSGTLPGGMGPSVPSPLHLGLSEDTRKPLWRCRHRGSVRGRARITRLRTRSF